MDIAKLCRICEANPDDDTVTKRTAAIKSLKTSFGKKKTVTDLLQLGSAVSEVFRDSPKLPTEISELIAEAIKKSNVSFVAEGRNLDIAVCGMGAVLDYVANAGATDGKWHIADVLAVAVWSATDFLPAVDNSKLEELRSDAIEVSRSRVLKTGLTSRERYETGDIPTKDDLTIAELAKATEYVSSNLKFNSAMDREEIDLLWWVLASRSEILDAPLATLNPTTRAIITGIEIGSKLRFLPSQSIRNLVLRDLPTVDDSVNIETILSELAGSRELIAAKFSGDPALIGAPNVFPLLTAITTNSIETLISNPKKSLSDWAARALLESSTIKVQYTKSCDL